MSWPKARRTSPSEPNAFGKRQSNRRPASAGLKVLAVAIALPLLAACGNGGFQPLYGSLGTTANTSEKLRSVQFAPIPGRVGQRVRNELIYLSTGGGLPNEPQYRLEVAIRQSITSTLVLRTGRSNAKIYNLDAKFRLINLADKKVILSGTSYGKAGFERFTSIFSNVRARKDAEDRAARTVAEDLKSRLAAFLATSA